ncbi:MAG: universal stress protein [Halanaerobacter sp.]
MNFKKVLLATDFSESAKELIHCIKDLHPTGVEEVFLTHIVNTNKLFNLKDYSEQESIDREKLIKTRNQIETGLKNEKKQFEDFNLKVKTIVTAGPVADKLVEIAKEKEMDLILISSHSKGYLENFLLGSTTSDVIRISQVPVFVERYKELTEDKIKTFPENRFNKVLFPTDLSKGADKVFHEIKKADQIVKEVIILSIIERNIGQEQLERLVNSRKENLLKLKEELEEKNIQVEARIEAGDAVENILSVAQEEEITSIVMPTKGSGQIEGLLIGSTTHEVVRKSKKPILVFPS